MIKVTRTFNYEANDNEILQLLRLARSVWNRDTLLKAGKAEMRIFHAHTLLLNPTINEVRTCEAFRKVIHEAVEMLRRDAKDSIEADHAEALEMNAEWDERGVVLNDRAFIAYWGCAGAVSMLPAARTWHAKHEEALEMNEAIDKAIQYLLSINPQTNAQWSDGAFDGTFNASGKDWHIYAVMTSITLTKRAQMEAMHVEALEDDMSYQNSIQCIADNLSLPVWEGCCETVKRQIIKTHHTEALIMNSEYHTSTGQGVSHNTKAYSAPLSLLGNGLLDGGVRFHVVPLLCVVLAVPGLKSLN